MERRGLSRIGPIGLAVLAVAVSACWATGRDDPETVPAASVPSTSPGTVPLSAPATTIASDTTPTTTTAPLETTTAPPPETQFKSAIGTVNAYDLTASWREGCPVGPEALRAVTLSHWGFDGEVHEGTVIVAADVAEDIVDIMSQLFAAGFPIERMEPIDVYGGDDDRSMAANNTSAFNCRAVTGGSSWSEHSYGTAIDVNPLVNPYVRGDTVLPPEGSRFADRGMDAPGMIHRGDDVVDAFAAHGWVWGGTWTSPKDYQHFSTTGR